MYFTINTTGQEENIRLNIRNFYGGQHEQFIQAINLYNDRNNPVYAEQYAHIYLGNPGDTGYVDAPVRALYLGSTGNAFGDALHFWLCVDHDGTPLVCRTTDSDAERSTCAVRVNSGFAHIDVNEAYIARLIDGLAA